MAGRKVFTSGEILTAADVNSFLMDQSVMVFADSTARSSAIPTPTEGMVTYVEDANRVEVYDGSTFGPIGGILQVVSTAKTDTFSASVASSTFVSITGLTASITPSSTSSKILVFAQVDGALSTGAGVSSLRLTRGGSALGVADAAGSRQRLTSQQVGAFGQDNNTVSSVSAVYLDSPSSTSSLTYGVDMFNFNTTTGTVYCNRSVTDADLVSRGRSISTITVMEVAV